MSQVTAREPMVEMVQYIARVAAPGRLGGGTLRGECVLNFRLLSRQIASDALRNLIPLPLAVRRLRPPSPSSPSSLLTIHLHDGYELVRDTWIGQERVSGRQCVPYMVYQLHC